MQETSIKILITRGLWQMRRTLGEVVTHALASIQRCRSLPSRPLSTGTAAISAGMGKRKNRDKAVPKGQPLTHFLCLPLVNQSSRAQLDQSFRRFRENQSADDPLDGEPASSQPEHQIARLPTKAIRPVGSLHCTLGVMRLSSEQLSEAVRLLESLDIPSLLRASAVAAKGVDSASDEVPASSPLQVTLKGLVSMHAPTKTSILFSAPHDKTNRLYPFCLDLQKRFKDAGLLVEDRRELKLHATVVNTIYAKSAQRRSERAQGHGPSAKASIQIDATGILADMEDFVWAEDVMLDRVAICEMGAKKVLDHSGSVIDEAYTEVATVALPGQELHRSPELVSHRIAG